jgi:hypothetical protein
MLQQAIAEEGVEPEIEIQRIDTDEDAIRYEFRGSPTIRVAGVDIDDDADLPVGLTCRAYRQPNGKISPLPAMEKIVAALRRGADGNEPARSV